MSIGIFETGSGDEVTLHGLEKWTCYLYEHLGWVTLAYESGREDKVESYIVSIRKLKSSIEARLKIITSEDAKIDLTTLLAKTKHLQKVSAKLFNEKHIRKTICEKCAKPIENLSTESDVMDVETLTHEQNGGRNNKMNKLNRSKSQTNLIRGIKKNNLFVGGKKTSKVQSKKSSKVQSKKSSKVQSKKSSKTNFILNKPLIKKLSKKSSKKSLKIFKKA